MENKNIEIIKNKDEILCIIIYSHYCLNETKFFTPNDFSQQMGYISHQKGEIIEPHIHNIIKREIHFTQEVLIIRQGKVRINLYDNKKNYFDSRVLKTGDVILLANVGHGFEFLEDTKIIEVKQGPYLEKDDIIRIKNKG